MQELLVKRAIETSSVVLVSIPTCFWFLSIWVVCILFSILSDLNCDMCKPFFKMPTIKHEWQLSQQVDYAFFIDLKDAYLYIPTVKVIIIIIIYFCDLCVWWNLPYQVKVLPFGIATTHRVFTSLTKSILVILPSQGFCINLIWMISCFCVL